MSDFLLVKFVVCRGRCGPGGGGCREERAILEDQEADTDTMLGAQKRNMIERRSHASIYISYASSPVYSASALSLSLSLSPSRPLQMIFVACRQSEASSAMVLLSFMTQAARFWEHLAAPGWA